MYSYDYCNDAFFIGIGINSKTVKTYGIFLKESSIGLFINDETNSLLYENISSCNMISSIELL